ncbi:hypothetical protein GO491_06930 [Flavobacteriaceae bacterium Ap0902]|nr:hypothetical protein [Flavobacteriaceae bacterium Ap0902]
MNEILEVIKYIFPMLVLGAIFYFLIEKFFTEQRFKEEIELKKKDRSLYLPQKFQAYERMALFIERIKPTHLVRRVPMAENADQYEHDMVHAIQEEFDHNMSQQIYIEPDTWKVIFSAKNATQNFIKTTRENLSDENDVQAFQTAIIHNATTALMPLNGAMLHLQKDIQVN